MKRKKPTNPLGVPVWTHNGIICSGDILKNSVRLTFPKGAQLKDEELFNASLEGNAMRAIDFHEGDTIHEPELRALIHKAVKLNQSKAREG